MSTAGAIDSHGSVPRTVVGIGASAGGLEALQSLFTSTPPDTGCAFVVIQHLAPDFRSLMDELLRRHTPMPVYIAENNQLLQANSIYLIPPRYDMIVSSGRLLTTDRDTGPGLHLPIDQFFSSLATDLGHHAIGIILSGTGSDGSRGVVSIKDAGGAVVCQDPTTAAFDGMPNSAIATGVVDYTLPPDEIWRTLVGDGDPLAARAHLEVVADDDTGEVDTAYHAVFAMLSEHFHVNFHDYKVTTIARRVERRLKLRGCRTIEEYTRTLEFDPTELAALYHDLLIGVTEFFRDPAAWERLARDVLPTLVETLAVDEELRCWVAGTATGEEAYTMAMLVSEAFRSAGRPVLARIFATDLHRASIEYAGQGIYPVESLHAVSDELKARYFVKVDDDHMQIAAHLRRLVVFAQHNLTSDPPFTKLDLVSCRNLLIYLQPSAQRRVLTLFHFSLRRGGALLLGSSESLAELEAEFDTIDRRAKVYVKRRDGRLPVNLRDVRSHESSGLRDRLTPASRLSASTLQQQLLRAYDALMDDYVPPAFLVDSSGALLHTFGRAIELLRPPGGRTTTEAASLVYPELRMPLTSGLQRLQREGAPVTFGGIRVVLASGDERVVRLRMRPLGGARREDSFLIVVEDETPAEPPREQAIEVDATEEARTGEHLRYLEAELRYAKENLQATVEELETTNEELQATNEELTASNEELQSSNEELHSVNEELYTVNREYEAKIEELTQLTQDMENLLASTRIGTIFLDGYLRVRRFTPAAANLFNLLSSDIGRPIGHLRRNLEIEDFDEQLRGVLASGEPVEIEAQHRDGTWYLTRFHPYTYEDGTIGGVVITFVDIQTMKFVSESLARRNADLQGFAYGVSHDLQEPVRTILGFAEVLRRRYGELVDDDGDANGVAGTEILDEVDAASARLRSMLDAMLVYSRVNSRGGPLLPMDLAASVDRVLKGLERDVAEAEVVVHVDPLPELHADEAQIDWLFRELLTNAIKFRGASPLRVSITTEDGDEGFVRCRVADNGFGIPEGERERVFDMFRRLRIGEDRPGLGAGLTIARRVVERHGGAIHVEAEPGGGTSVVLTLPVPPSPGGTGGSSRAA